MSDTKSATIYRMVLPDHVCPFGVRAKGLLEGAGYAVDDQQLTTRDAVDSFMAEHGVSTTPQVYIGATCVGGCDETESYLAR